jgi:hypothetical protein
MGGSMGREVGPRRLPHRDLNTQSQKMMQRMMNRMARKLERYHSDQSTASAMGVKSQTRIIAGNTFRQE